MVRKIGIYNVSRAAAKLAKKYPENETIPAGPANYEQAISAAGFGKFNYLLLFLGAMPANWVIIGSMMNISQIVPSLQCYFNLNVGQIGILNASLFIGNITSPFLWGYIADTTGRRKLMIWTTFADVILIIISSFSINVEMLSTLKALSGFVVNMLITSPSKGMLYEIGDQQQLSRAPGLYRGIYRKIFAFYRTTAPGPVIVAYLSECHGNKHRTVMILGCGVLMVCFNVVLPLLTWGIIPINFHYINSWQVYMMLCALPSLITFISFNFFPETPRYLMTAGKHDEALAVFQKIYSINSGNAPEQFPIKQLLCENKATEKNAEDKRTFSEMAQDKWKQFRPMFYKPYLSRLLLTTLMQIFLMMSANALRSWLPAIVNLMDNTNSSVTLCQILQDTQNKSLTKNVSNITLTKNCSEVQTSDDVYIKLTLVGVAAVVMYIVVTVLTMVINKKIVLVCMLFISGILGVGLIWYTDPVMVLVVCALFTVQTGVALITFMSMVVDLFPTSFRAFTLSLVSTSGRLASVIGNLIFPALLVSGCTAPFIYLGTCGLVCIIPILLLRPNKEEEN